MVVSKYLSEEELHSARIEFQRERLQQRNVVLENLVVREVEIMHNELVHMIVRQDVICLAHKDE